jgi:hypothetical protein
MRARPSSSRCRGPSSPDNWHTFFVTNAQTVSSIRCPGGRFAGEAEGGAAPPSPVRDPGGRSVSAGGGTRAAPSERRAIRIHGGAVPPPRVHDLRAIRPGGWGTRPRRCAFRPPRKRSLPCPPQAVTHGILFGETNPGLRPFLRPVVLEDPPMTRSRKTQRGPTLRDGLRAKLQAAQRWAETAATKAASSKKAFKRSRKAHRHDKKIAREARREVKALKKRLKALLAAAATRRRARARTQAMPAAPVVAKQPAARRPAARSGKSRSVRAPQPPRAAARKVRRAVPASPKNLRERKIVPAAVSLPVPVPPADPTSPGPSAATSSGGSDPDHAG